MSAPLGALNANAMPCIERNYGVHEWGDRNGNHGTQVLSERQIRVRASRVNGLFDYGSDKTGAGLAGYFNPEGTSKRKIFVVVDSHLPDTLRTQIEGYLVWCKMEKLLEDYMIMPIVVNKTQKTLEMVSMITTAAIQFGIRRRDLFVVIGSTMVTDMVGFVAAIYRRSTPYILVPTDLVGIVSCYASNSRVSIDHVGHDGIFYKGRFALSHLPIASFYDPSFLDSLSGDEIRRGLAEMAKISVIESDVLFSYIETFVEKLVAGNQEGEHLMTLVEHAARAAFKEPCKDPCGSGTNLSTAKFGDEAVQAIEQIKGVAYDDADSVAIGVALMSALSFLKRELSNADLGRILSLLEKAELPICDDTLEAVALWKHMIGVIQERGGDSVFIVPISLGKEGCLNFADISLEDVGAALDILRKHSSETHGNPPELGINMSTVEVPGFSDGSFECTTSEVLQYHVVSVQGIFDQDNPTIIQNYCVEDIDMRKKKILIVVDDYLGNTVGDIGNYFESHRSAIDGFSILAMHVSSKCKDTDNVLKVIDAAIALKISQRDLFIVVGGGTLMDIVGFAAAIYKGGIRYLRIPTTLVGIIDAGVGVKVGVNFGDHKNFLGRYFAPVACLNDPATFLVALPQREFACGLAEAIKMAVLKSPRLFELIGGYHNKVEYSTYTHELIQISIRTMLEELQPNLYEQSLLRLVDFGHEFGHIVESLAGHEVPHGECVAIGMAISSFLAHSKGILSRIDLERILNLILDMGLPIYVTEYDCCNPSVLWAKICTEGIEHKDGMLYLAVPETIGRARFLDNISDIDAEMVSEAVLSMRRYADWYTSKNTLRTNGLDIISPSATRDDLIIENINPSLTITAAINGASADIGSQLADSVVHDGVLVICSIRSAALHTFRTQAINTEPRIRECIRDLLDLANQRIVICEADILYNMAGVVIISTRPDKFAKIIAVNGFAQGIITQLIQQIKKVQDITVVYPSSQRVHLSSANAFVDKWVQEAGESFFARKDALVAEKDIYTALKKFAEQFIAGYPLPNGLNVYEISKRLGEHLMSSFPRHSLLRASSVVSNTVAVDEYIHSSHQMEPIICLQYPETFKPMENEDFFPETILLKFDRSEDSFYVHAQLSPVTEILERSLNMWFNKLSASHQEVLTDYIGLTTGLSIRLRADAAMTQCGEFTIKEDGQHGYQGFIDVHAGLATRACHTNSQEKIDDIVGHEGFHLLAFLSRGRSPLVFEWEREREEEMAEKWEDFLGCCDQPHVIVLDIGATYLRVGVLGPHGRLLHEPARFLSPSKHSYPQDTLARLQERLVETLISEIEIVRASHIDLSLEEVGISFGAVISHEGIVEDASVLWTDSAQGYDFKNSLLERLPDVRLTILNDVSAAAWRYEDEGRFCLITVSSGLSNKIFNPDLRTLDKLDLDAAGLGGEMGHVVVEPRAVDALVRHARLQATAHPEEFRRSQLSIYVHGNVQEINARYLGMAVKEFDNFAVRLLEEADVPYCSCGNLADLCSYSSGRGALRHAQALAARGGYDITSNDITDSWLQAAIAASHPLALKVLYDSTYPLALRILQLAADIGLEKFIIVGGYAMKTGKSSYLQALQNHLVRFCHNSGYFSDWREKRVRDMVRFGVDDDNDGLIGVGHFMKHVRAQYLAVVKAVGKTSQAVVTRSIPCCGAREILAKVVYSGICTTDLEILRGERELEPMVLGHECVCQVVEVGKDVTGLSLGSMVVLNPNNPVDEHDKLGHSREGVFQQYVKFGQEVLERNQVLRLGNSAVCATDALIEPLSCVVGAQDRIKDRTVGKNVLVIGAGVMGLLFVLMSVKNGARNVFLANRSKEKLDFAVTKGIIQQEKVFVIGNCVSSQVDKLSVGEGVDIVIITVSFGQGIHTAQEAITYVNSGGCVYLFSGFRAGDVLTSDRGARADVTSIRSGWKTEQIRVAGKPVKLSGHRGSRYKDLAMAASLIRGDSLSFGRLISHIVSLNILPEIMLSLARDGNIQGAPAKRVIVDMDARDKVVESAEELPFRNLHEAARKRKDTIPMGNLFREIGFEGNSSLLGWVCPPAWQDIKITLDTALQINALNSKQHYIFVGTGGWVFLVDVLKEIIPASQDITLHTLQSLDPQALENLFSQVKDLSMTVCLGISKSGRTMETVMLMNALRERFDNVGLDYREHFVWLTDTCKSVHDCKSGEAVIRGLGETDWKNVDMVPLSVKNYSDINALFCAPHSVVMFLTLVLLLRKDTKATWHIYQQYLGLRDGVVHYILPKAYSVASNNIEHIQLVLDESIAPAMVRLVTQLIEQALGSKQVGFTPRVRVTSCGQLAGFEHLELPMPTETPMVVKVMLTMNALAVFVAMVAYHRRIAFVTHPKVNVYKRKAVELLAAAEVEQRVSDPRSISDEIIMYLSNNPQTCSVEVLCYGVISVSHRQNVKDWLISCLSPRISSRSVDVVKGEEWNHSVYQAAVETEDSLYVIMVLQEYCDKVAGISKETIYGNVRMLRAIARATYETLLPKALQFRVGDNFWTDDVLLNTI